MRSEKEKTQEKEEAMENYFGIQKKKLEIDEANTWWRAKEMEGQAKKGRPRTTLWGGLHHGGWLEKHDPKKRAWFEKRQSSWSIEMHDHLIFCLFCMNYEAGAHEGGLVRFIWCNVTWHHGIQHSLGTMEKMLDLFAKYILLSQPNEEKKPGNLFCLFI